MRIFSLSRWRPQHLLLAWIAYWIGLVFVTLGPAMPAIWRATHESGRHGEVSANVGNTVAALTVRQMGQTTWTGSAHLLSIALWFALPPLVLWVVWVARRSRPRQAERAGGAVAG